MVIRARTFNDFSPRAKNASRYTRLRHGTKVTSLIIGKRNGECEVCPNVQLNSLKNKIKTITISWIAG